MNPQSSDVELDSHILARLTYGARPEDFLKLYKFGDTPEKRASSFIEYQLHPENINDQGLEPKLQTLQLSCLSKSLEQLWQDHVVAADLLKEMEKAPAPQGTAMPPQGVTKKDENRLRLQPALEVEQATWMRAIYSERQLFERVTEFWHDHFSVFAWDNRVSPTFVHYDRDVIRKHALGNFREFLEAVTKSPAMLHYLDNELNQSGNPNENYARELFELHTLGAMNYLGTKDRKKVPGFQKGAPVGYVDGDVYEAARAFTGWRVAQDRKIPSQNTGEFEYFEPWHDRFQKIVLGRAIPEYQAPLKDGHDVLDILANHPGTSQFIATKLCRRFVSDVPPMSLVNLVAKTFYDNRKAPDQIRKTLRVLLNSHEFNQSKLQKVKRPFDYTTHLLRSLEADFTPTEEFLKAYERTGQRLFGWRTPDGIPDQREKWLSANSLLERFRLTNQILSQQKIEFKIPGFESGPSQEIHQEFLSWRDRILKTSKFAQKLPPESLSSEEQKIMDFLNAEPNPRRLAMSVSLLLMSPGHQWR
jgi:uncharacterized protein (DUF1800 family)